MTPEDPLPTRREPLGLAAGQVLGERYEIERHIGGGGMGEVFLARHLRTGRPLAVKLLGSAAAREPESVERFEREARVLGSLRHPGIVGIHDFDKTPDGRPFLVMDYLQGEELGVRLGREGALPWSEASRIFEEVAGALHAAHGLGVLHRDLKPGNIFLARSAASPERAVLLDFGLSKDLSAEEKRLTRTGLIMGTPLYMSPEQARGTALDVRSDVYSLSAVLYELVSGRPPFEGASWTAILSALLLDPPPPFSLALLENLPPQVDGALRRALSKDPAFRPPDVLHFAADVLCRPPVWAGALGAPAVPTGEVAGGRGFVTGPTAWADSGDAPVEAPGSARTVPSGSPAPVVALPSPDGLLAQNAPGRAGAGRSRLILLLGAAGLLGAAILALALLAWPSGKDGKRPGGQGTSGMQAGTPGHGKVEAPAKVGARTVALGGAKIDAGALPARDVVDAQREATPAPPDRQAARRVGARPSDSVGPVAEGAPSPPEQPRPGGPSAQPPIRPLTQAQMLASLPANEQAILAAMQKSDWAGCIRATRKPPETDRILQMRVSCAWSGKRYDLVVSTCKTFMRRFPSHPYSHGCGYQIRSVEAIRQSQAGSGMGPSTGAGAKP